LVSALTAARLPITNINYVPLNVPLLHVVFCEDGTGIDRVMIAGKIVVEEGRVRGIDTAKLATTAADAATRLAEVNANARTFVEALEPVVLDYCVGLARAPYHTHHWCGHVSTERQP
jgi:5-methylthioadenosine/S-adenosylhomocysteine deaminase